MKFILEIILAFRMSDGDKHKVNKGKQEESAQAYEWHCMQTNEKTRIFIPKESSEDFQSVSRMTCG